MESPLVGFLVGFDPLSFDELSRIKMDQCVDRRPRKEIPGCCRKWALLLLRLMFHCYCYYAQYNDVS